LFLEPELVNRNIPYTFYKKPGLFLSDEALYLSLVLHAVFDPGSISDVKKALLTPFFKYEPEDLYDYGNQPVSHPLNQLFLKWNDQARSRKWGLLFQSLMEESGLIFREARSHDWDRKSTNYRQIFEHLETVAYAKKLDFRGLCSLLDSYRKQTVGADDDADIHQIETEDRKVQIMTMHVSKGLQFPVVFIAGCSQGNIPYIRENDEADVDEERRLLYVAMTRARERLFFTRAEKRRVYGKWIGCRISRFIESIDGRLIKYSQSGGVQRPVRRSGVQLKLF